MLWLCLHLPDLALEIFANSVPTADPLVVVCERGRKRRVALCNAAARLHGVRSGMGLDAARALVGSLRVCKRDEESERAALDRLATWACQFTSVVSLMPPQALLLEVSGSDRLFGGVERLREMVGRGLTELGYHAFLAIAPTPLAASWLAHAGREVCISRQSALAGALASLPLTHLGLAVKQGVMLQGMGVRTIGDCLRLPRDGVGRRAGPELVRTLDQALGRVPDPRPLFVVPPGFTGRLPLPAATGATEAILFPLRRLLLELEGFLRVRDAGARLITLSLHHAAARTTQVDLELVTPSRDAAYLAMLLRERLERVVLPALVEEVSLYVVDLHPLVPHSLDLFAPGQIPAQEALIERLRARLGRDAVHGLGQVAEHRPERAWCYVEPGHGATLHGKTDRQSQWNADSVWSAAEGRKRPLWLLCEPVLLEMRDRYPYLGGVLALSPERERIESGWWDGLDIARDYFVARSGQGAWLWVYREVAGEHRWFLHGLFG